MQCAVTVLEYRVPMLSLIFHYLLFTSLKRTEEIPHQRNVGMKHKKAEKS